MQQYGPPEQVIIQDERLKCMVPRDMGQGLAYFAPILPVRSHHRAQTTGAHDRDVQRMQIEVDRDGARSESGGCGSERRCRLGLTQDERDGRLRRISSEPKKNRKGFVKDRGILRPPTISLACLGNRGVGERGSGIKKGPHGFRGWR